jgi:hypothetical protein
MQTDHDILLSRALGGGRGGFCIDVASVCSGHRPVLQTFGKRQQTGIDVYLNANEMMALLAERPRNSDLWLSGEDEKAPASQYTFPEADRTTASEVADNAPVDQPMEYPVRPRTFAAVCGDRWSRETDLLRIEVGGLEEQVFLRGDWGRFRPWLVVVETSLPGFVSRPMSLSWESVLISTGIS